MKKILGVVGAVILFIIMGVFVNVLSEEQDAAQSKYDENFISKKTAISLKGKNAKEIQAEILNYGNQWMEIKGLSSITIYLDEKMEISRYTFNYCIENIKGYSGYLEIICDKDEEVWQLWDAKSVYNYGENLYKSSYSSIKEDLFLQEKLNAIISYIHILNEENTDIYRIMIIGSDAEINAYNTYGKGSGGWKQRLLLKGIEKEIFVEPMEE